MIIDLGFIYIYLIGNITIKYNKGLLEMSQKMGMVNIFNWKYHN